MVNGWAINLCTICRSTGSYTNDNCTFVQLMGAIVSTGPEVAITIITTDIAVSTDMIGEIDTC